MPTAIAKVYRRRADLRAFVTASCLVLCLALVATAAAAPGIPAPYSPVIIEPIGVPSR
jgi:hypothetical protein